MLSRCTGMRRIRSVALGNEHSHVAVSLNNLGVLLLQLAKPDEAEPLIQRALAISARGSGRTIPIPR